MAREEHDREDLLAEATALVERASFRIPGCADEIVVGFRRDGSASFYFGPQRVYHFTSAGSLRRAFVDDALYKAQQRRLFSMRRQRRQDAVELASRELDARAARAFLAELQTQLSTLTRALADGRFTLVGQVPRACNIVPRIQSWLKALEPEIAIARSPRVG
jgi:hypothetical protein